MAEKDPGTGLLQIAAEVYVTGRERSIQDISGVDNELDNVDLNALLRSL